MATGEKARTARAVVVVALCADGEGIMGPRKWKLLSQCDPKFEICRFSSLSISLLALAVDKVE